MAEKYHQPPKIARWLFHNFLPESDQIFLCGDFDEIYNNIFINKGRISAQFWYWCQLIFSLPPILMNSIFWSLIMFKNYMKIAIRNLAKQKIYSAINILGLSVGLACAILIYLFIVNELSYDRFHENSNKLHRVFTDLYENDGSVRARYGGVTLPMGPAMEEFFPEIKYSIRVMNKNVTVKNRDELYNEKITLVDKPFFAAFSFPLVKGNPSSVFSQPNLLVLTENHARKYFGEEDPVGKILTLISGKNQNDFIISGVAKEAPSNSTITFNILLDMESGRIFKLDGNFSNWSLFGYQNYVLLEDKNSLASIPTLVF